MKTITTGSGKYPFVKHTFEIVERIPKGFFIWNIGANMGIDDYIPICESTCPNDPECYNINPSTLKAIRLNPEDVQKLRGAASVGVRDLKTAEKALKSRRRGYWNDHKRKAAENTIDIFKRISE